jgi:nifR3 family TIM-barrel protein
MSEMISADGLIRNSKNSLILPQFTPQERPFGIQLFGNDGQTLSQAAEIASRFSPDFIDLNCGCPAKKVVRKGAGAALMGDLPRLETICKAMRRATTIPLTIKFRSGVSPNKPTVVEAARIAETCGFDAVIVHPRHLKQAFTGKADWHLINAVKSAVKVPVIGNGDINSPQDALRMFHETGCDMVMVGRGALGNPWIFAQISGDIDPITPELRLRTINEHYRLNLTKKPEIVAIREMRKHLIWYTKGLPDAVEFRRKVTRLESAKEVLEEINTFFNSQN